MGIDVSAARGPNALTDSEEGENLHVGTDSKLAMSTKSICFRRPKPHDLAPVHKEAIGSEEDSFWTEVISVSSNCTTVRLRERI